MAATLAADRPDKEIASPDGPHSGTVERAPHCFEKEKLQQRAAEFSLQTNQLSQRHWLISSSPM